MPSGGYRKPGKSATYSGVGKNSRRTDGQPIRTPNVQEGTDLTIGDGRVINAGMRTQPLGRTPSPRVSPTPSPTGGGSATPPGLPEHLFSLPTSRPMEPETEGASFGPGAGPEVLTQIDPDDDKEFVLHMLSGPPFNNQAAANTLRQIQAEKQTVAQPSPMAPGPMPSAPTEPEPQPMDLPLPAEPQIPVEEPEAEVL